MMVMFYNADSYVFEYYVLLFFLIYWEEADTLAKMIHGNGKKEDRKLLFNPRVHIEIVNE